MYSGIDHLGVVVRDLEAATATYRDVLGFAIQGGEELPSAAVEGLTVTPLICYDLRFPEPFRAAASRTHLFVVIASWPVRRAAAWRCLLQARAIENQCFVLGVNRVGTGDGLEYGGDSALVDPLGQFRSAAAVAEGWVLGEVAEREVTEARGQFSFLKDRREDVYRRLRDG